MPTFAFVARVLDPEGPVGAVALGLAGLGHEVHALLDAGGEGVDPASAGLVVHRLPDGPPRRLPMLGPRRARRDRRAAIARLLRAIGPGVVHLDDPGDLGVAIPAGAIVLHHGLPCPDADATVLPDGRFLDRSGQPVPCPGIPPMPSGGPVDDGLDPVASARHWRVLAYLAGLDQLRRDRRTDLRFDRPHRPPSPHRLSPRQAPVAAG